MGGVTSSSEARVEAQYGDVPGGAAICGHHQHARTQFMSHPPSVAPPLTRRAFLVCVTTNEDGTGADTCDSWCASRCVDPGSTVIHTELMFTVPCLGAPERCLVTSLPSIMLKPPIHVIPKTHLVNFRVMRSTFWSALPPWLSRLLGLLCFPFFALASLFTCSKYFPCWFDGVVEDGRRQFQGGMQCTVDRRFDKDDRFVFHELRMSEEQRDRMFLYLLSRCPDPPVTDDYHCCAPGYNYLGCVGLLLRACMQKLVGKRCAGSCCAHGLVADDLRWRGWVDQDDQEHPDDVELNRVEDGRDSAEASASASASIPFLSQVAQMRARYPLRPMVCSEGVAAALNVASVLDMDPRIATPHVIYQTLHDANMLTTALLTNIKGAGQGPGTSARTAPA